MTTETMNVHRALSELKTISKRIYDEINGMEFVIPNKHSNTKIGGEPIKDVSEGIKASYARVNDLIKRRNAIKAAVIQSNAVTNVVVAGRTYTVAQAIDMKDSGIGFTNTLLRHMTENYESAKSIADRNNGDALERRADDYLRVTFSSTGDSKNLSEEMQKARAEFVSQQTMELIDPLGARNEIKKMNDFLDEFFAEVDAALSVSNAITEITVTY